MIPDDLRPVPPYNFALIRALLDRYPHPTLDVVDDGAYWRVLQAPSGRALLRVTEAGSPDAPRLLLDVVEQSGQPDPAALRAAAAHILNTDEDPRPFYAYARTQPTLWAVVEPLQGLRWLRAASVFEALMITIIEQQIAWRAAQRAQRWLVEWADNTLSYAGRTYYAFPTPPQIAAASVEDLHPLKITFRRMGLMIDLARQVDAGALDLDALLVVPVEEAYARLLAIKGIGHWTATWTLQRARGTHNYVSYNDVALQAAVNHYFYGGEGRIPAEQVTATFARYGEFAGYAAQYTTMRWVMDRY